MTTDIKMFPAADFQNFSMATSLAGVDDHVFSMEDPDAVLRLQQMVNDFSPQFFEVSIYRQQEEIPVCSRRYYIGNGEIIVLTVENPDHPAFDTDEPNPHPIYVIPFDGRCFWVVNDSVLVYVRSGSAVIADINEEILALVECDTLMQHEELEAAVVFQVAEGYYGNGMLPHAVMGADADVNMSLEAIRD